MDKDKATKTTKQAARPGGRMPGMLICILVGHRVAWGPCDRCNRRARG